MKLADDICTSRPVPFPSSSRPKITPVTEEHRTIARERDTEIHELCRDTNLALQELRDGVAYVPLDILEKTDLDLRTLVQVLDARPSVVLDLLDREFDNLTTEIMIEYLEKLCVETTRRGCKTMRGDSYIVAQAPLND